MKYLLGIIIAPLVIMLACKKESTEIDEPTFIGAWDRVGSPTISVDLSVNIEELAFHFGKYSISEYSWKEVVEDDKLFIHTRQYGVQYAYFHPDTKVRYNKTEMEEYLENVDSTVVFDRERIGPGWTEWFNWGELVLIDKDNIRFDEIDYVRYDLNNE